MGSIKQRKRNDEAVAPEAVAPKNKIYIDSDGKIVHREAKTCACPRAAFPPLLRYLTWIA